LREATNRIRLKKRRKLVPKSQSIYLVFIQKREKKGREGRERERDRKLVYRTERKVRFPGPKFQQEKSPSFPI
jgi:hypothetical protein